MLYYVPPEKLGMGHLIVLLLICRRRQLDTSAAMRRCQSSLQFITSASFQGANCGRGRYHNECVCEAEDDAIS